MTGGLTKFHDKGEIKSEFTSFQTLPFTLANMVSFYDEVHQESEPKTRRPRRLLSDDALNSKMEDSTLEQQVLPMSLYTSLPLGTRKHETRILELRPGLWNSELAGELKVVSLRGGACPEYQALSYTWGTASSGKEIYLNGEVALPLTDNLFNALRRLRGHFKKLTLWVDAICINQASIEERGDQVSFMDRIFGNAISVIIWLGEPAQRDVGTASWSHRRIVLLGSGLQNTEPRWHERAWVAQEFFHARRRYICAGDLLLEYDAKKFLKLASQAQSGYPKDSDMHKEFYDDNRIHALRRKLESMNALANYGIQEKHLRKPDMLHYQSSFRETITYSTDPRDAVYSLLSLITPEEAQIIGSDYRVTASQVYAKATYASFIVRKNLDILFGKPLRSQPSVTGLPTWALDFGLPSHLIKLPTTINYCIQSSPLSRPFVRLDADMLTLRVNGHRFDTIKESMNLDENDQSMKSRFATAFFGVLRDLRMAAGTQPPETSLMWRMGKSLKPIPDPDLDRWLSRILEGSSSTRKIVVGAFLQYWSEVFELPKALQTCKDIDDELLDLLDQYYHTISSGSAIFVTEAGFIGLAPKAIAAEDEIVLLPNERHPVILRKSSDYYTFHGLAYVHGLVDGRLLEADQDGEPQLEEFVLK